MEIDLSGRIALVTGGSRNIGRAISLRLGEAGATVVVGYLSDVASAEETCQMIRDGGGRAVAAALALDDPAAFPALVAAATVTTGPVDILVNNAAIRPRHLIDKVTPAEWDEVFALNTRAPFFLAQTVLPHMIEQGFGRILCIGGISAYIGQENRAAVIASKLAIVGVARALAFDTAKTGVTVNVIVPGMIDTTRGDSARYGEQRVVGSREANVPMGRLGYPEDVADLVCFFASEHAGFTTGQELFVTGGGHPLTSRGVG
jgi:3-oxoacyl-[acyl-carrier protein] reductase